MLARSTRLSMLSTCAAKHQPSIPRTGPSCGLMYTRHTSLLAPHPTPRHTPSKGQASSQQRPNLLLCRSFRDYGQRDLLMTREWPDWAFEEVRNTIIPGTQWPDAALQAMQQAMDRMSHHCLFVQCGTYAQGHPKAGQPAYAFVQVVCLVQPISGVADAADGQQQVRNYPPLPFKQPKPDIPSMVTWVVIELDKDGWPTEWVFERQQDFINLTTSPPSDDPMSSVSIIMAGKPVSSLRAYYQDVLVPLNIQHVDELGEEEARYVNEWVLASLQQYGFKVISTL